MTATVIPFPDPDTLAAILKQAPRGQKLRPYIQKQLNEAKNRELHLGLEYVSDLDKTLTDWLLTGGLAL